MSDHKIPVEIFTDATWEVEMLSSLLPNRRLFTRLTRSGLTTMRVGNQKVPLVQRLARKLFTARTVGGLTTMRDGTQNFPLGQRLAVKLSSEAAGLGLAGFGAEAVIPIRARPSSRSIRSQRSGCRERPASQSARRPRAP